HGLAAALEAHGPGRLLGARGELPVEGEGALDPLDQLRARERAVRDLDRLRRAARVAIALAWDAVPAKRSHEDGLAALAELDAHRPGDAVRLALVIGLRHG